jgi:hypothetical protein
MGRQKFNLRLRQLSRNGIRTRKRLRAAMDDDTSSPEVDFRARRKLMQSPRDTQQEHAEVLGDHAPRFTESREDKPKSSSVSGYTVTGVHRNPISTARTAASAEVTFGLARPGARGHR